MKISKYESFLNESFFRKIFTKSKKTNKVQNLNRVDSCVNHILNFLAENDIFSWNGFMKMSPFDRLVIDKIIDSEVKTMKELKEVRFKLRLELSNKQQLMDYKQELQDEEEYEKCALIVKKLSTV